MRVLLVLLAILLCNTAHATEYKAINPSQLNDMLDGKPQVRLIFFFTSWCSVCKKSYSELLRLEAKYKNENVKIMAVSLDEDMGRLKHFMRNYQDKDSNVYHLQYSNPREVMEMFHKFGIHYNGGIPHVTLLDQKGKIVADGSYDLTYFDRGLDQLLKRS